MNILADGTTAFTRDIANGGNAITEEIQRQLGIGRDEAESYKCGGEGRGIVPREVPEIVNQAVEQLAGEIQRSLDFYLATSGDRDLSRICLSGGTANIQALLDILQDRARCLSRCSTRPAWPTSMSERLGTCKAGHLRLW